MNKMAVGLALSVVATGAQASTPDAWSAMNQRAGRACVAMSGLARPQLLAKQISYSDTIGVEVRMLRGVDRRGRAKQLLCAFDRRTGRAEVQEAGSWLGPTVKP